MTVITFPLLAAVDRAAFVVASVVAGVLALATVAGVVL